MKEIYSQLHQNMLAEIDCCKQLGFSEKEKAENCFKIARNYREKLKEMILIKDFEDQREEIDFFRNVKPKFACYIEFFAILSGALSIIPSEKDRAVEFWKEEGTRFIWFCNRNSSFVEYYESGDQSCDENWFVRENNDLKNVATANIYDADLDFCTSHDRLVRDYMALKMYRKYVKERLALLDVISFNKNPLN